MQSSPFAAQLLEVSAAGYAGYAASLLVERIPQLTERYGPGAHGVWKASLTQRTLELAAAVRLGTPELFVARVLWTRKALESRGLPGDDLVVAVDCLGQVMAEQLPEAALEPVQECLQAALMGLDAPVHGEEPGLVSSDPNQRLALEYLASVLEGDVAGGMERVLQAVDDGLSLRDAYLEVLAPAMAEIGRMWHKGTASVAGEHLITATTGRLMSRLAVRAPPPPDVGRTALVATVAGNAHELGVRILADFFEMAGWRVVYLGTDVPSSDLVTAVQFFDVDLLVMSAALSTHLREVETLIEQIRRLDRRTPVLVGGRVFTESPDLWRAVGADGFAHGPEDALEVAATLVGMDRAV